MGISTPTSFVSLNDLAGTRNSLSTLFTFQDAQGLLPYSGPTINAFLNGSGRYYAHNLFTIISSSHFSATYHCWTLLGVHSTWLYTGDVDLVQTLWENYTKAIDYLEDHVGSDTGLVNSTDAPNDWIRQGGGGYSISPNALYYRVRCMLLFVGSHSCSSWSRFFLKAQSSHLLS